MGGGDRARAGRADSLFLFLEAIINAVTTAAEIPDKKPNR